MNTIKQYRMHFKLQMALIKMLEDEIAAYKSLDHKREEVKERVSEKVNSNNVKWGFV